VDYKQKEEIDVEKVFNVGKEKSIPSVMLDVKTTSNSQNSCNSIHSTFYKEFYSPDIGTYTEMKTGRH
jgi:hypothetical protein